MAIRYNPSINTNNLQLLLDAGNSKSYPGSGTTWFDISGKSRNFTWTGAPTFSSTGASSHLVTTGLQCSGPASNSYEINNGTGYTVIMVSKTLIDEGNAAFQWYGDDAYNRGIYLHPGWTNTTMYFDQGGCCEANQRLPITYTNNETKSWSVWAFRSRLYDRSQFCNGVRTGHTTTYAANINLNASSSYVVAGWTANINLFALYNTGLDDDTIATISRSLMARFR
jgi:hypothetical protein